MNLELSDRIDWQKSLLHLFATIDDAKIHETPELFWTLGGGFALMLRYQHRLSKDIDIFLPDIKPLGFVVAPSKRMVTENSIPDFPVTQTLKLTSSEGSIDMLVQDANLTSPGYERWTILNRAINVETATEVIAKKMWYRGDAATVHDLYDLSITIEQEPTNLKMAKVFLLRHSKEFLKQFEVQSKIFEPQFNKIDKLNYRLSYKESLERVAIFLNDLAKLPK